MRNTGRVLAIIAAIALAAVATVAITVYVRGVEQRAFEDAELVEVFIATQEIPAGLTAAAASEAGVIERDNVPRSAVPDGALTSLEQIDGLVTIERVLPGEVLVIGRWEDPTIATTLLDIPEGFEAVSVQVAIPPGVAGFVQSGDTVSLLAHLQAPVVIGDETDEAAVEQTDETRAQYLLQNVTVLNVGQALATSSDGEGGTQPAQDSSQVLMTLALAPTDVEKLVFAINEAQLYFTLLPEGAEPAETPGRTFADLFD